MNRKRMAWVLVIAILAGCFANYGAVRAEDRVEKYLYLEGDSPVARLSVSGENKDMLSGTLAVTGSAVSSLFESESSGNFYVTTGGALSVTGGAVTAGAVDQIRNTSISYVVEKSNKVEDTKSFIQLNVNREEYDDRFSDNEKLSLDMYYISENEEEVYYLGRFNTKRMWQVDFITNEGGKVEKQLVEEGGKVTKPAEKDEPTWSGHKFTGWYKDPGCGDKFEFEKEEIRSDTKIYAGWKAIYKVTFDTREGSKVEEQLVEEGGKATKPAEKDEPTWSGYEFTGWYKDSECTKKFDFEEEIRSDTKIYAGWEEIEKKTYTVTFNTRGGSAVKEQSVEEGGKATKPTDPIWSGHKFIGWYKDLECTKKFDFKEEKIEANTTIYAGWEKVSQKVEYTITYDPEDGSMPPNYIKQYETGKGLEEKAMPVPSREGYLFGGWYSDKVRVTGILPSMTGNLNLKAKWYAISITCDQNKKYVAKGTVLTLGVEIDSSIKEQCKFIWSNGRLENEKEGAAVAYEVETVGTQKYICKVVYGSYNQSVAIEINGYKAKIDITLYKTKSTKDIFGKKVPLETLAFAKNKKKNKKYLTLNKSKGTIKVKKYVKSVKLALKVEGQKITVIVSVKLPKPKIKLKRGKVTSYAIGKYRTFKLVYKNIKGADRVVSYYSKKKNKGYKKGGKSQNRKKGALVSIPKGSKYYFKVVAYYGKTKSPQSSVVKLKG